ncbi:hypothetical protein MNBD_GAMMA25-2095 [hydrothermal vent metagenome]|uniref:DUF2934 domain-containing protein n=1 Tax=hydrothermal vent metagenome TaxID=652676 RepID=A0A3B1B623_9ZZZZ
MAIKKKGTVAKSPSRKKTAKKSASKKSTIRKTGKSKETISAADARIRQQVIAEAAYFLSLQRGSEEGSAQEDWLTAEAQVDRKFAGQKD